MPSATDRQSWNFIGRVSLPPNQRDAMTSQIVARVASGVVKTAAGLSCDELNQTETRPDG
jgi:hypothetical protein